MKIKTVCEITGLSDRTIRYYIDEGLIKPSYTENYLGRRSFDFSDKDIRELTDISVLRKFDFTIDEIRSIINVPDKSSEIIFAVKSRTEIAAAYCKDKLDALSNISFDRSYSIDELASELSKSASELPAQNDKAKNNLKRAICLIEKIGYFAVVLIPFVLSMFFFIDNLMGYHYPVLNPIRLVLTLISFIPSVIVIVIFVMKLSVHKNIKRVLLILCILAVPFTAVFSSGIIIKSETTNLRNYRDFDAECIANRNAVFQELFPGFPDYFENVEQSDGSFKTVYSDAQYYYSFYRGMDYTFDIYAEWSLNKMEYIAERDRVIELFNDTISKGEHYKYTEEEKGNYYCYILYETQGDNKPFEAATDNYAYLIFACNEEKNTVRYIYCESLENGVDQPYYLSLPW